MSREQVCCEFRDIIESFAEGREVDFEGIDAEEQVFAEAAFLNHLLEFAVGGADDSNIDMEWFVVSYAANFAGFEESEEFDLHAFVEFAEFVEEQSSAVGDFEETGAVCIGAGEGAASVSEEFAFDEVFGDGAAVDGDEGFVATFALFMDASGDHFLASAGFSEDENSGVCGSDAVDESSNAEHGCGIADQV